MCLMHPIGTHECFWNNDYYRKNGPWSCTGSITLPPVEGVMEEYQLMADAGWVVVPTTGTLVCCSEECAAKLHPGWITSRHRIKPRTK